MKLRNLLLALALTLLAGGCATTNETDAAKLSWGDLSDQERLKQYLEARRQVLASLQVTVNELGTKLLRQVGQLRQVEKAYQNAAQNNAAARTELREIELQRRQADQTLDRIAATKAEIERNSNAVVQANAAAAAQARQRQDILQKDVQRLEAEAVLINDEIQRTLRLREEQTLRDRAN